MKAEITELTRLLTQKGIALPGDFESKLLKFSEFFLETSKTLNLTAIKQPHEIMIKHYYDSIIPLGYGLIEGKVIDVGCGGGFPSIPLKIANDRLSFTLLDSLKKRLIFLDNAIEIVGLTDIQTLHARAEEASRKDIYRDSYDTAVSRAVASLPLLCELCLPFVKLGGRFIAYKTDSESETSEAKGAIKMLSGEIEDVISYKLPENMGSRSLVVIKKIAPTHPIYPRSTKNMSKGPLK